MQNLRDQLLKARLIDRKTKKQADREARTKRKKEGYEAVVAAEAERDEAFERKLADQRKRDRKRERQREEERRASEARHRLRQLVLGGLVPDRREGPRRFYFVTRAGRIPSVQVTDELGRELEAGRVAIVEVPFEKRERFELVTRDTARRLGEDGAPLIRFWNR